MWRQKDLPPPPRPRRATDCGLFEVDDTTPDKLQCEEEVECLRRENGELKSKIEQLEHNVQKLCRENEGLLKARRRVEKDYLRQAEYHSGVHDLQFKALANILSFVAVTASEYAAKVKEGGASQAAAGEIRIVDQSHGIPVTKGERSSPHTA